MDYTSRFLILYSLLPISIYFDDTKRATPFITPSPPCQISYTAVVIQAYDSIIDTTGRMMENKHVASKNRSVGIRQCVNSL